VSLQQARGDAEPGQGVTTFVLLLLLFFSLTGSIAAAEWTDGLDILGWAALGGVCFGWMLAKMRRLPGVLAHLTAWMLAVPVTAFLVTFLLPPALTCEEKLILLRERSSEWFLRVAAGGPANDNLIFVIQTTWLMWLLAYVAAWFVYRRRQVWGAIVPGGAVLLLNSFYAAPPIDVHLGFYLLCALLLLVRTNLHALERRWRANAVGYTSDVQLDVLGYGALFTLILLSVAWVLPASAPGPAWLAVFEPLHEPWQSVENNFARAFSALRAVVRPAPAAFSNAALVMGGPVSLEQRPVMEIRADHARYWRARVYDKYSGSAWFSTLLDPLVLNASDPRLDVPLGGARAEVTQTVKVYFSDQHILHAQSQPVRFSVPVEVRAGMDRSTVPPALDVTLVRARRPLREGDVYVVVSAISIADEDALRADSTAYPEWIRTHYLQLPADLPERVRLKAQEIAEPFSNPYDRAVALERFLRAHITYDEKVSAPPLGVDGVDYVLFERPSGYCNYYASAMAVMARTLGIPARVVSGYAPGAYADGVFHIVEANAHTWVEIYFPTYGWIEFEPTANRPALERSRRSNPAPEDPEASQAALEQRRWRERSSPDEWEEPFLDEWIDVTRGGTVEPQQMLLLLASAMALGGAGAWGVRRWLQWQQRAHLPHAARVYEEMLDRARWLGVRDEHHATPFERADAIGAMLPSARNETAHIAMLYTRERFGAYQLNDAERAMLARVWTRWRAAWWRGIVGRAWERIAVPARRFRARTRHAGTLEQD